MSDKALIKFSAKLAMECNETFKCAVCFERLSKPIQLCKVGHMYCEKCKAKLNDCAICRQDFSDDRNVVMEQLLENSTFPCKYEIQGCKIIAKHAEITKHEECTCDFKIVQCCLNVDITNVACPQATKLCDFKEHVKDDHLCRERTILGKELRRDLIIDVAHQNFRRTEVIEILRDEDNPNNSLFFLEKISYNNQNKVFFVSYHYIGLIKDAEKYQYFLHIRDDKNPALVTTHQNKCLQSGLSEDNVRNSGRSLIMSLKSFMNVNERRKILSLSVTIDHTEQEKKVILKREQREQAYKTYKKSLKSQLEVKEEEVKNVVQNDSDKISEVVEKKEKLPVKIEELPEIKEEVMENEKIKAFKKEDRKVDNEMTMTEIIQKWFSILIYFFMFVVQIIIHVYFLK